MDRMRGFDDQVALDRPHDDAIAETTVAIGNDERRMHVRAYNHWASLIDGAAYPLISALEPDDLKDFGPHSVLLDFTVDHENPSVSYIGAALRAECGLTGEIDTIADVPQRSLLSRLTDHYLEIIANRAPIGFEAEFVNARGGNTLYRGILMPYSSTGEVIDFIYGVINWKEIAAYEDEAGLIQEIEQSYRAAPRATVNAPVWADGPQAEEYDAEDDAETAISLPEDAGLADWLEAAREGASLFRGADSRSRAALYRALGLCYDFALVAEARPDDYVELLEDAGMTAQARAPMTPIVKLVFGVDYDKARITEFAAALAHGRRLALGAGELRGFLEGVKGGLKAVVKAERALRAPVDRKPATRPADLSKLREAEPKGIVQIATESEFVLLVARRVGDNAVAVIEAIDDAALLEKAIRQTRA